MVQETETLKHTFQGMLAHVTLVSVVVWLVGSPSRLTTTQPRLEPLDPVSYTHLTLPTIFAV